MTEVKLEDLKPGDLVTVGHGVIPVTVHSINEHYVWCESPFGLSCHLLSDLTLIQKGPKA